MDPFMRRASDLGSKLGSTKPGWGLVALVICSLGLPQIPSSSYAQAQGSRVKIIDSSTREVRFHNYLEREKEKKQASLWQAQLNFETAQYLGPLQGSDVSRNDLLVFSLEKAPRNTQANKGYDYQLQLVSGHYTNATANFFYVNELYAQWKLSPAHRMTLGRRYMSWAKWDEIWDLGLWQPLGQWDPLRPFNQGLTGLFWDSAMGSTWSLTVFVSPIFVPTMGPPIAEENGSLSSASRWYRSPVESGPVLNKETRFTYSLAMPTMAKLVQQNSLALKLRYQPASHFWAQAAWAQKPMNQLMIEYDYNLALSNSLSQARVEVTPTVLYHQMASAEVGYSSYWGQGVVGIFQDQPQWIPPQNTTANGPTDWIRQDPSPLQGAHLSWRMDAFNDSPTRWPVTTEISLIHINGGDIVDRDSSGKERGSLIPDRLNWQKALQIRWLQQRQARGRPLLLQLRAMREWEQKGNLLSLGFRWNQSPQLSWYANLDVLGVDDTSSSNTDPGFFNQFRTNDRLFGGMSYVF
jgi:hypothetical protein